MQKDVMNHHDCENLDAYLLDELAADATYNFDSHLDQCERCRYAVEQQRWIDGLLRSPFVAELEPPSESLATTIRTRVMRSNRQVRTAACVFAAAAVVIVAVGWTVQLNRQAMSVDHSDPVVLDGAAAKTPPKDVNAPRATFVGGPDVLVVPVESPHPNVTIVRIYPAYLNGG
jgi:anti-sigma factor RsiW